MAMPRLRRRQVIDHLTVDGDGAAGDLLEAGDEAQQRRLAAARRADEDDEFARRDVEIDALDHFHGAKGFPDAAECEIDHMLASLLSLDAAGGQAGDDLALEDKDEDDQRQR